MGKPTICIGENKDADQLRGNREADQRLCFRYLDSTIPLLLKSEISRFKLFSVTVQAGLCQASSETTLLVFPRGGSFVLQRTTNARTTGYLDSCNCNCIFDNLQFITKYKDNIHTCEHVGEKTNNLGSNQVPHKPAYTGTENG